jgi:ABC-2 type transport system ATP-binding protein
VRRANGVVELRTERPVETLHELTGWALDNDVALGSLEVRRPTLEDVYIELTSESGEGGDSE